MTIAPHDGTAPKITRQMKTTPVPFNSRRFRVSKLAYLALLLPWILAPAQDSKEGNSLPENPAPASPPPTQVAVPDPILPPTPPPGIPGLPAPAAGAKPAASAAATARTPVPAGPGEIVMNFQNASLTDVLNYLSEAAGFVIVQEVPVTGTVNIISHKPVKAEEAVDLLNTVLAEKGFTAIRNGRVLQVINRRDAPKRDIPVVQGSEPGTIPKNDLVVTQILPVKYGDATKLVENLRPLLSDNVTITANEASNTILMTDTQVNIHRIATIIKALDTSVANISMIRIFPLQYADAKQAADLLTSLFATPQGNGGGRGGGNQGGAGGGRRGGGGGGFGGFGGFFGGGGGLAPAAAALAGPGATLRRARLCRQRRASRRWPIPRAIPWLSPPLKA